MLMVTMYRTRQGMIFHRAAKERYEGWMVSACNVNYRLDEKTQVDANVVTRMSRCTTAACKAPAYTPGATEPGSRYSAMAYWGYNCCDCGGIVTDRTAHDRHHDMVAFGDGRFAEMVERLFARQEADQG
jgi:hypothetical protein